MADPAPAPARELPRRACSPPPPREFAARGYAGANVDRIARAARLNKAMIYYHFSSKAALYREILRDMFERRRAPGRRGRGAPSAAPEDKIRGFVDAIAAEAEARPHFPPIWLREIAEGGEHVDAATLALRRATCSRRSAASSTKGVRAGRFQPRQSAAGARRASSRR